MAEIGDTKKCKFCGNIFTLKREWQKFCSDPCRKKYWTRVHKDSSYLNKKIEALEKEVAELKGKRD